MSQAANIESTNLEELKKDPKAIFKHIFKIDGVLDVCERAESLTEATRRVVRMWPRSTVEFLREEFSHYAGESIGHHLMVDVPSERAKSKKTKTVKSGKIKSVEENMTETIANTFGGK